MMISFRPGVPEDFDYCARLYFAEMETIIRELKLDRPAQTASFRRQWNAAEARIIMLDGAAIGWLQSAPGTARCFLPSFLSTLPFSAAALARKSCIVSLRRRTALGSQ
jgi:hypothetical protein